MQSLCCKGEAEGSHRQGLGPVPEPLKESVGRGRTMRISRGPQSGELVKNTDTWAPPDLLDQKLSQWALGNPSFQAPQVS